MAFKISLKPSPKRGILQSMQDYDLFLNGKMECEITYNMGGYIGYLPLPEGGKLDIGECAISIYRREIAALNREARLMECAA